MDYSKIGLLLKRERERKGLSYEQIFEITRIQPSVLKGIEEGSAPVAPVFLKSFMRKYARFLALDPERLFREAKAEDKKKEEIKKTAKKADKSASRQKKSHLRYIWPLLGLFIAFQAFRLLYPSEKAGGKMEGGLAEKERAVGGAADFAGANPPDSAAPGLLGKKPEAQSPWDKNLTGAKSAGLKPPKEGPELKSAGGEGPLDQKNSLFEQIKAGLFQEDILIRSSAPARLYFKADGQSTVTKNLEPFVWFQIKAKNSVYLRMDERRGDILIFHKGRQEDMGSKPFFERTFKH